MKIHVNCVYFFETKTSNCDQFVIQGSDAEKEEKQGVYNSYLKLMKRDKRRFVAADADKDGKLSKNGMIYFRSFFFY